MGKLTHLYVLGVCHTVRRAVGAMLAVACAWYAGETPAATPTFSEPVIASAMTLPLLRMGDPVELSERNYQYARTPPAVHYLALVVFFDPNAETTSGERVADRVAAHLRNVVLSAENNAPRFFGGFYAWNEHHLGGFAALARHTPAVWDLLDAGTKERLEWLMNTGTYVANLQRNAGNECYMSPHFWHVGGTNPNQANSMVAWMSYAYIYYGGAAAVNSILAAYDPQTHVNKVTEFGWKGILAWASRSDTQDLFTQGGYVENQQSGSSCRVQAQGVRAPFTFNGRVLSGDLSCPDWNTRPGAVDYEPFYSSVQSMSLTSPQK